MNEKLLELAEQAGWMMDKEIEGFNTRLEKFAELFLDECIDTMIQYGLLEDQFGDWLREKLSEKFGFQNKKSQDELKPTPYPYLPTYINPRYSNGCPVCGIGKNNTATGYVCHRDDCPTKITC